MPDLDLSKYSDLVADAVRAFRADPSYAEDMARQASSRQDARRERELEPASH